MLVLGKALGMRYPYQISAPESVHSDQIQPRTSGSQSLAGIDRNPETKKDVFDTRRMTVHPPTTLWPYVSCGLNLKAWERVL
jgi:hypothetical protein